jgi:hypothetical protein
MQIQINIKNIYIRPLIADPYPALIRILESEGLDKGWVSQGSGLLLKN